MATWLLRLDSPIKKAMPAIPFLSLENDRIVRQPTKPPSLDYGIPDFNNKTEGEFEVNIAFQDLVIGHAYHTHTRL